MTTTMSTDLSAREYLYRINSLMGLQALYEGDIVIPDHYYDDEPYEFYSAVYRFVRHSVSRRLNEPHGLYVLREAMDDDNDLGVLAFPLMVTALIESGRATYIKEHQHYIADIITTVARMPYTDNEVLENNRDTIVKSLIDSVLRIACADDDDPQWPSQVVIEAMVAATRESRIQQLWPQSLDIEPLDIQESYAKGVTSSLIALRGPRAAFLMQYVDSRQLRRRATSDRNARNVINICNNLSVISKHLGRQECWDALLESREFVPW